MARIVQKFGGAALSCLERIKVIACEVKNEHDKGNEIVVVVSAQGGVTNELIAKAKHLHETPSARELDMLMATGEQESAALLSIALQGMGVRSVAYTGIEAGILTTSRNGKARIVDINESAVNEELRAGKVVVVAGFQGADDEGCITTLGRGGSDLTAVALGVALKADRCEIFTDVDGVYNADPKVVPEALKIETISFDQMLELTALGAKVMQVRSVECAKKYNMPFVVRSSYCEGSGTLVGEGEGAFESFEIQGVTIDKSQVWVEIDNVGDRFSFPVLCQRLGYLGVGMDMVVYNKEKIEFGVSEEDMVSVRDVVGLCGAELVGRVALIGVGFSSYPEVIAKTVEVLTEEGIEILNINSSELRIACVVRRDDAERAVRALHIAFGLGNKSLLLNEVVNF